MTNPRVPFIWRLLSKTNWTNKVSLVGPLFCNFTGLSYVKGKLKF